MAGMQIASMLNISKPTSSGKSKSNEVRGGQSSSQKSFKDIMNEKDFSADGRADTRDKSDTLSKAQTNDEEDIKPKDKKEEDNVGEKRVKEKSQTDFGYEKAAQAASMDFKGKPDVLLCEVQDTEGDCAAASTLELGEIPAGNTGEEQKCYLEAAIDSDEVLPDLNAEKNWRFEPIDNKQAADMVRPKFVKKAGTDDDKGLQNTSFEAANIVEVLDGEGEKSSGELEKLLSNLNLVSMKAERVYKGDNVENQPIEGGEAEKNSNESKALKGNIELEGEDMAEEKQGEGIKPIQDKQGGQKSQNTFDNRKDLAGIEKSNAEHENSKIESSAEPEEADKFLQDIHRHVETKNSQMSTKNQGHQVFQRDIMRQISQQIRLESTETLKSLEIKLEPENLGKVVIKIMSENGVMSAKLVTSNDKVKMAIDSSIEDLKESLSEQGIDIKSIDVSVDSDGSQESFEGLFKSNAGIRRRVAKSVEESSELQFEMDDLSIKENPYISEDQEFNYLA